MLEWNVFYYNSNTDTLEKTNILYRRERDIANLKQTTSNKSEFSRELHREMLHSCGPAAILKENKWKVNAFQQLDLNWNHFVDYCWNYKEN